MKQKYFITFFLFLITKIAFAQDPFLGEIKLFSGYFAPKGWALCNGQLLPINQNQALFSILGTTYGGDGRVNFALPDLRGRVVVGQGDSKSLGQKGGAESVIVNQANIPSHQHNISITMSSDSGTSNVASPSAKLAKPVVIVNGTPRNALGYTTAAANVPLAGTTTSSFGSANPVPIPTRQPSLGLIYIIALQGIFPSQN